MNLAHYRLIEIAAELARCQHMPTLENWTARRIGTRRVMKMLERAEDEMRKLAMDVRDAADIQAMEISRLRGAISQVVRESHVPSTGIVALHIVDGESEPA